MRAVVQRVSECEVRVAGQSVGKIHHGLLILIGVALNDTLAEVAAMAEKICGLRIFSDPSGKMNLSVKDVQGSAMVVSQFTLLANTQRGRRPSYIGAAQPELARFLYERFVEQVQNQGVPTATGQFAAQMEVRLVNDGPVTIVLDFEADAPNKEMGEIPGVLQQGSQGISVGME